MTARAVTASGAADDIGRSWPYLEVCSADFIKLTFLGAKPFPHVLNVVALVVDGPQKTEGDNGLKKQSDDVEGFHDCVIISF